MLGIFAASIGLAFISIFSITSGIVCFTQYKISGKQSFYRSMGRVLKGFWHDVTDTSLVWDYQAFKDSLRKIKEDGNISFLQGLVGAIFLAPFVFSLLTIRFSYTHPEGWFGFFLGICASGLVIGAILAPLAICLYRPLHLIRSSVITIITLLLGLWLSNLAFVILMVLGSD